MISARESSDRFSAHNNTNEPGTKPRMLRLLIAAGAAFSVLTFNAAYAANTDSGGGGGDSNSSDQGDGESGCDGSDGGGDCPEEDETASDDDPVETNEGEAARDQDTCDDSGGGNDGSQEPTGGHDNAHRPVTWETGEKWETETDLVVRLPGTDYRFTRQYSSEPMFADNPYDTGITLPACVGDDQLSANVGSGWGWSNLRAASGHANWVPMDPPREAFAMDTVDITIYRPTRKPKLIEGAPGGTIRAHGPGNQNAGGDFDPDDLEQDGLDPPGDCEYLPDKIYYEEPGRWKQTFDLVGGAGWIEKDEDEYGNIRTYVDDPAITDSRALPDDILLNGTSTTWNDAGMVDAWIELYWDGNRLVRAEVYRPSSTGGEMTQYVQYYHLVANGMDLEVKYHDGTSYVALDEPGTSTLIDPHTDLGTEGDLVMVVKSVANDPGSGTTDWRRHVTQYRYHDGGNAPTSGDIRQRVQGATHQLKSQFEPHQIEFMAQERSTSSTPDDMAVVDEAIDLLELADADAYDGASGPALFEVAAKIISYELTGDSRVEFQFIQSGNCGCGSGGAATAVYFTYEWLGVWSTTDLGPATDGISMHQREHKVASFAAWPTTVERSYMYDLLLLNDNPYVWNKVIVAGDVPSAATTSAWVSNRKYDASRGVSVMRTPSSITSYTPAIGSTDPDVTIGTSGLTTVFVYDGENASETDIGPHGSTDTVVFKDFVTGHTQRRHLLESIEYPRLAGSLIGSNVEKIEFEYGYESAATAELDWRKRDVEREYDFENGPSATAGTVSTWEFFDDQGQRILFIDEEFIITRYEYDSFTGTIAKITRNFDPDDVTVANIPDYVEPTADPVSSAPTHAGGVLITEYERDLMGRVTKVIRPGGVESWMVRGLDEDAERPGILYYATISMPHQVVSPGEYAGPARKRLMNAAFETIRSERWDVENDASYDPGPDDYATNDGIIDTTVLGRSVVSHDISGQMISSESWWNIADDLSYTTTYEYDAFGRMTVVTDGTGTITEYAHDVLDRAIEVKVGTGTTSETLPVSVAKYYYDGDPGAAPSQGYANGNLTHIERFDGVGTRTSRMYYDDRDRMIGAVYPDSPMSLTRYDNLNRPLESAVYPEPGTTPTLANVKAAAAGTLPNNGTTPLGQTGAFDRSWYTKTFYGQRGLVYMQQAAITPASSSTEFLEWHWWYDDEGNELASWAPNSPGTLRAYDAHDRVTTVTLTDRAGDTSGLGTAARFGQATGLTGDHVLEESSYTYSTSGANPSGVVTLSTSRMRKHDASATGALADTDQITRYMGYLYDDALRRVATLDFGTAKTTGAEFSTAAASVPSLAGYTTLPDDLRTDTDILFSWVEYDERGQVHDMMTIQDGTAATDEIRTRYVYDDLGRTAAVIENVAATSPATVSWSTSSDRYVASGQSTAALDEDRVTSFEYNAAGAVVRRIAHIPGSGGEEIQETVYEYGTTVGSSSVVTNSLVASNRALATVKYPDETTGSAGTAAKYKVSYAYNRLGELRGVTDQNGTIRELERDDAGRVQADIVDTVGSYSVAGVTRNVDSSIRRLGYAFDSLGRLDTATSYTDTAGTTVRDQVELGYTPLWQIESIEQDHDSAVSSSPTVEYEYDNQDPSGSEDNYSRLSAVRYPAEAGTANDTVEYRYASGVDDRISRVTGMDAYKFGSTGMGTLADYERIGMGMTAKATLGSSSAAFQPMLDRTMNHNGTSTAGEYPAYDRHGRVERHMWVRDDSGPHATDTAVPKYPPILEVTHTYDRSSNRLSADDARPGAQLPLRDRDFSYDGLHRLTEELRTQTATASYSSQHQSLQWQLDMLGNWDEVLRDADEDGVFTDNQGTNYKDTRTHNYANEIESNAVSGTDPNYDRRLYSTTVPNDRYSQHRYDDAGNMTDDRSATSIPLGTALMTGKQMAYDAWNRLITTEFDTGSSTNDISEYTYNALGWRTSKTFDASQGAYDGVMEQKRLFYYGASWRIVEEHIDIDVDTSAGTDWIGQQFWGLRYIDDAIAKRVDRDADEDWEDSDCSEWYQLSDAQFSVCAVLNEDMNVYERVEYDAYGVARHRPAGDTNGDGVASTADIPLLNGANRTIDQSDYHADYDVDLDGDASYTTPEPNSSSTDLSIMIGMRWFQTALPDGWISDPSDTDGPDNSIGYAGYVHNPEREDYTVRFRVYSPELGRWRQRDPISFKGGATLFLYAGGSPVNHTDPTGLAPVITIFYDSDTPNFDKDAIEGHMQKTLDQCKCDPRPIIKLQPKTSGSPAPVGPGYADAGDGQKNYYHQLDSVGTPSLRYKQLMGHNKKDKSKIYPYAIHHAWQLLHTKVTEPTPTDLVEPYANVIFHEVFFHGLLRRSDPSKNTPGYFRNQRAPGQGVPKITAKECAAIGKKLGVSCTGGCPEPGTGGGGD